MTHRSLVLGALQGKVDGDIELGERVRDLLLPETRADFDELGASQRRGA